MKAQDYSYYMVNVSEDPKKVAFRAVVPKFPELLILIDPKLDDPHDVVMCTVQCAIDDYKKAGKKLPAVDRVASAKFKGKILIRISPQLHEKLYLEAKASRVSLNSYIEGKLG